MKEIILGYCHKIILLMEWDQAPFIQGHIHVTQSGSKQE